MSRFDGYRGHQVPSLYGRPITPTLAIALAQKVYDSALLSIRRLSNQLLGWPA